MNCGSYCARGDDFPPFAISKVMRVINGYRVIGLQFPPVFEENGQLEEEEEHSEQLHASSSNRIQPASAIHYLYIKEHHDKANSQNKGKTLFIGNVDYSSTIEYEEIQQYLTLLFQSFGEIQSISISEVDQSQGTARFAHILFEKKSAIKYILKTISDEELNQIFRRDVAPYLHSIRPKNLVGDGKIQTIITNVLERYGWKPADEQILEKEVNEFMQRYEQQEMRELLERKEMRNQPDEDGFITVVSR